MDSISFEVRNFEQDVIKASYDLPVLVDFWADWCGPCKFLGPIIEKLAIEGEETWRLVKVNTEQHPDIAREWGIRGIPNLKLFYHGHVIDEVSGAMNEVDMRNWLHQKLPSKASALCIEAQQLASGIDPNKAKTKFERALELDPDLVDAKVGLAKLELWQDPEKALTLTSSLSHCEQAVEIALIARALVLDQKTLKNDASKTDFLDGLKALNEQRIEDAMVALIRSIAVNKRYLNEFSRKLVIALFHFLGESHEITKKYRRKFDMVLY